MKKVLISILILTTCCARLETIHTSPRTKKCVSNLELLEKWIEFDLENDLINQEIAEDYLIIIRNTQLGLHKKKEKRLK